MRSGLLIFMLEVLISGAGGAQEIRFIDLSSLPETAGHRRAYGSMIEADTCIESGKAIPPQVRISLEWVDTTDLYPHGRVKAEFLVENVGTTPLRLPIHPTLADLKPRDAAAQFLYYRAMLQLEALVAEEGSALVAGDLELFGSTQKPGTLLTLSPGEWIRVKGDVGLQRWYKRDQNVTLAASLELSKHVYPARKFKMAPLNRCFLDSSVGGTPLNAYMHAKSPANQ